MRTKLTVLLLNTFLIISGLGGMKAQVTIGHSEAPETHAILQIKDQTATSAGGVTAKSGGIVLPSVELENKYQLLPFYQGDTTDTNYKTVTKPAHTGLVVYNLKEDDEEELCLGFNQWDGGQWNCFQVKKGNAIIDQIYCNEIVVYGNYVQGVQTTGQEYIVIPVNVTKAGAYTFTVNAMYNATTPNGYSFTTSGEFLFTGKQSVTLTAQGIPTDVHFDAGDPTVGDALEINYNGDVDPALQCSGVVIPVAPPLANYSIYCGSYKVYGVYTVLPDITNSDDDTHYIELDVEVSDIIAGGGWTATTDRQNGLSFRGSGTFTALGRQKIRLYAVAGSKANTYDPIELTLSAETLTGSTSCKVTVRPAFTRKKIIGISNSDYAWGYSANAGGSRALLTANYNFGNSDESTVKMVATNTPVSGNTLTGGTSVSNTQWTDYNAFQYRFVESNSISEATMQTVVNAKPDMIILGFDHEWTTGSAAVALKYLNDGGIIFDFNGENGSARIMLNTIFGLPQTGTNSISVVYGSSRPTPIRTTLANMVDPILQGPFQPEGSTTLGGLDLGGDTELLLAGHNNIPTSGIIVYGYNGAGSPTVFRTSGQRYFVFGDGGFLTNRVLTNPSITTSSNIQPFAVVRNYDSSSPYPYKPAARASNTTTNSYANGAYNSFFFANLVAWAVSEAQYYGVNSK
jgi:hypothetical protein